MDCSLTVPNVVVEKSRCVGRLVHQPLEERILGLPSKRFMPKTLALPARNTLENCPLRADALRSFHARGI